jgi:hypothetical protein
MELTFDFGAVYLLLTDTHIFRMKNHKAVKHMEVNDS